VAAHPDDENTRLLAYFSKDRLYRTGYLSLTRGDGGQNLIGEEQGIDLGLIRTQELLAARKMDGAEQYFSRAYDFGFSKNPEETFQKWDKEKILADVVWVIRRFQPDVIITRFPTTGEGGHGHHTASAILANEAFTAAADPKRFPEQLQWVQPWQAKRILWNAFNFGSNNTTREDQFRFDVGGYNPVLGKSYGEIAAESRSQHKSQGFGVPRSRGEALEYFKTTGGSNISTDLFEDVTTSWQRIKGAENVAALIQQAIASFNFLQPQQSVPTLVKIHQALEALPSSYWRDQKLKETKQLIEDASGLWLETVANQQFAVQGDSLRFTTTLNNRLGGDVRLKGITFNSFDTTVNTVLSKNRNWILNKTLLVPAKFPVTQPYWLKEKMQEGYFTVREQELIGQPDVAPAFTATYALEIEGQNFTITKPVRYKFTDPVKGELYQPVSVLPSISVNINQGLVLFKKEDTSSKKLAIEIRANKDLQYQQASAMLRSDKNAITTNDVTRRLSRGNMHAFDFSLSPKTISRSGETAMPFVKLDKDTSSHYMALTKIQYDHIPTISYLYTDAVKLLQVDLKTRGKRIGYITGAGDKVPEALEIMGYEVTLLSDKELQRNNLKQFDAIISGVRAYNTNAQ
jgi:LmbE family N-acetylglucosaminyl deacetylase